MTRYLKYGKLVMVPAVVFAIASSIAVSVQAQPSSNAELATQITESRAQNQQLMKHYSWTSRTEVKIKGEQKVLKSEANHFVPDGQLVKTPIGHAGDSGKKRGIKGKIVEKKKSEMRDWAADLQQLLHMYSLPTAGKVLDFINAAQVTKSNQGAWTHLEHTNVVQPGDKLTFIVDSNTKSLLETIIETELDGDKVHMRTNHRSLDSGLSYTAESMVTVPDKNIEMNVQNFTYIKN